MIDHSSLSNRTAIVTGASSGIGKAIALKLSEAGAHVFLAGRTAGPMEEAAKRIEEKGGKATAMVVDVRDPQQISHLVDSAVKQTGRLNIMVNNAGVYHVGPIADGDLEKWREMLEINILALLVGCRRQYAQCVSPGLRDTS